MRRPPRLSSHPVTDLSQLFEALQLEADTHLAKPNSADLLPGGVRAFIERLRYSRPVTGEGWLF